MDDIKKITRICNTCQKSFELDLATIDESNVQQCCCSDKCNDVYVKKIGSCSYCGKEIQAHEPTVNHLFFAYDKYCCTHCQNLDIQRFVRILDRSFSDNEKLRKKYIELLNAHTMLLTAIRDEAQSLENE